MISLQTSIDDGRLNIRDYDIEELRRVAESGGVLYVNYEGMWGKIPNAVLRDVFEAWDAWAVLMERHPDADPPRGLGVLVWEQTTRPQDWKAVERARSLRPRQQSQSQSRSTRTD